MATLDTKDVQARVAPAAVASRRSNRLGHGPQYREAAAPPPLEAALAASSKPIENAFLRGNFGPVAREFDNVHVEALEGAIPADFPQGTLLRNGPNPYFEPICRKEPLLGRTNYHWFEGDGMIHAVSFGSAGASYRNRWIRTPGLEKEVAADRPLFRGVIDADAPALLANFVSNLVVAGNPFKNTANTALVHHAGQLLALNEGAPPTRLDLQTLQTVGEHTFAGEAVPCPHRKRREFTAHPKVDPGTGEMVFFSYQPVRPYMTLGVVGPAGEIRHLAPVDSLQRATVKHDFAITPRFSIILDMPLVISPENLFQGKDMLDWQGDSVASRIGVMPRYGQDEDVQWFKVQTGFVFHTVNAYEEGDVVVLRGCRSSRIGLSPEKEFGENWAETYWRPGTPHQSCLYEWRLNLATGRVTEQTLSPREQWPEFPVINDRYVGRKHRFAYCVDHDLETSRVVEGPAVKGFIKYTFPECSSEHHNLGPGRFGCEPAFVPRRGADEADEDNGWLVGYVYDEAADRSEVVIIDCKNFAGPPVCRLALPARVPFGFHGIFVPAEP